MSDAIQIGPCDVAIVNCRIEDLSYPTWGPMDRYWQRVTPEMLEESEDGRG